jgi:hypothetical protein
VHHEVGVTVVGPESFADVEHGDVPPPTASPTIKPARANGYVADRLEDPELGEDTSRVGRQLEAGPQLDQLVRLLLERGSGFPGGRGRGPR